MKQKVRAANFALKNGYCDIQICGYNSLYKSHSTFWRMNSYTKNIDLKKVINIPSVSTDEEVLSIYLLENTKVYLTSHILIMLVISYLKKGMVQTPYYY